MQKREIIQIIINNTIKNTRRSWLFFLDLIFPRECLGCGEEGEWLCTACFRQVTFKLGQYCLHCKKENQFGQFCPTCKLLYDLDGVMIAFAYEQELITKLIKSLKYNFLKQLADELNKYLILFLNNLINQGRLSSLNLKNGLNWQGFLKTKNIPNVILDFRRNVVVPVPLAKKRLRWRGFNQAELLARGLANHFGLDLSLNELVRTKHKKPQAKLNERQRQVNIKDCFSWQGDDLARRNVILIDDVVTTGSTLNECAKILKANGAGEVWGLVVSKG